jgi:hypothetical protein
MGTNFIIELRSPISKEILSFTIQQPLRIGGSASSSASPSIHLTLSSSNKSGKSASVSTPHPTVDLYSKKPGIHIVFPINPNNVLLIPGSLVMSGSREIFKLW